jgi:acid phosphatase (class A)
MRPDSFPKPRASQPRFSRQSLVLLGVLCLDAPAFSQTHYLTPGHPDGVALLAPPPVAGSEEETADLVSVRKVFEGRTSEEKERANKDSKIAFSLFTAPIGPAFQLSKLPKTEALLVEVKDEIGDVIDKAKNHFKRKRPYQLDPQLSEGAPEPSFSYPSGHSTRGTVYSMIIAELFPEHREAVLQIGRNIGWDRVLIGKHFPTDIYAGRVVGKAIVNELMSNPAFQKDLAEAKAEIASAQTAITGADANAKPAGASVAAPQRAPAGAVGK